MTQLARGSVAPGAQRWTIRGVVGRAAEVLRGEGLRSLWFKALGETVYRRLLLYESILDGHGQPPVTALPLEFRFLSDHDVGAYAHFRPDRDPAEAAARLREGDRCYVAWDGQRIVAARWVTEDEAYFEYLDRRIPLAKHTVYRYDAFTSPAYRGRGIIGAVGARVETELRKEGVRRIIGSSVPENAPSRRMFEKQRSRPLARIGYVKLGRRRWDFGPKTL